MASINTIVKRKQYLWLGIVVGAVLHTNCPYGAAGEHHMGNPDAGV